MRSARVGVSAIGRRIGRDGNGLFGLVVGLLVGVMVSALVFPKDVEVVVEGGAGEISGVEGSGGETAAGDASTLGGTEAGAPGGQDSAATAGGDGGTAQGSPVEGGGAVAASGGGGSGKPTVLKIGVGVLDLGAIRNLGAAYDNGDGTAHMQAWLAGARRDGLLPVNGYDVSFVYRKYDVVTAESQRAACRGFVQDDKVLAVLAGSNFQLGAECVAREFKTPLITSDALPAAAYGRAPMLFTFMMSSDRLLKNWVNWAHGEGELRDKKIGVFYSGTPENEDLVRRVVKPELQKLGYSSVEAAGSTSAAGGHEDGVAAQRFQAEGVQVVFMMASPTTFTQQAERQGFRPRYLLTDHLSGTTNTATSNVPPEHFDGSLAMSGVRYGEWRAGMPTPDRAAKCAGFYERASGSRVDPNKREAEWIGMNKLCDGAWALLQALAKAPPGLDKEGLVKVLESLRGVPLGIHDDATFEPGRHDGGRRQRTLRWHGDCRCWKAIGAFAPLFVQ